MAENNQSEEQILNSGKRTGFAKFFWLSAIVTLWAIVTGYYQAFSFFPAYDDEGYLMMTVKQFLEGRVLYDEIYTQYGAAYYFYKGLFHTLTGLPVTHNVTRLTTLVVWILISFLCGLLTYRLTRSAWGGAAGYLLTFLMLFSTVYEPGHPQEFAGLLLVCCLLFLTGKKRGRSFDAFIGLAAAALALLFLTKINLGVFLGLALAVGFLALTKKSRLRQLALTGATILAAALPFVLFRDYLSIGWLRLSILVAAALISALVTSLLKIEETTISLRHYGIAALSFSLTALAVFTVVYFQGTTFEAFFYGIFFQHLKFGADFFQPAPIQRFAHFGGIFALLAAFGILFFQKKLPRQTAAAISILKLFFALCVIAVSFLYYFSYLNTFLLLSFATPFLWIPLLNREVTENAGEQTLARVVLVLTAILQPLQIFPIAGTQRSYGTFLMLVAAVVCLCDALAELKILLPKSLGNSRPQTVLASFLVLMLAGYGVYRTLDVSKINRAQTPLGLRGADFVKLPEEDVALYRFLTENLKSDCGAFVSMPGFYSLHFWSAIEPPTTFNTTAWMTLLSDVQQRAIIEKLEVNPERVCAVYNPQLTQNSLRDKNLESIPLAKYILENLSEAGQFRNYRLMIRSRRPRNLVYAARVSEADSNLLEVSLPTGEPVKIARIQLFDWPRRQILADSQNDSILLFDSGNQSLNLPFSTTGETTETTSFRLKFPAGSAVLPERDNLLLRLLDADGKVTASLPVLK